MKKINFVLFLAMCSALIVSAQEGGPTQAPAVKTFALQPDLIGNASNSVNLFTGDVALPLNLVSLPGRGGLDVSVAISYNSNVQHIMKTWNLESPTGILGLGWTMDMPKIIVDHKNTGAREDDTFYLIQGGGSNRLVRTTGGSDAGGSFRSYETKQYQFWKIKFYDASQRWELINENGIKYVYGDKNSTRKTLQYAVAWDNWIGNSSQVAGQSQIVTAWNLSEIINTWSDRIVFEYDNVEQFVGSSSGQKQTEASYLKQITDALGRKVQFFYSDKDPSFYTEPHTEQPEPDAYQEVYEKKYLDSINVLSEAGNKFISVDFGYGVVDAGLSTAKMLLTSIIQKNASGTSLPGIQLEYNTTGATKGFLKKMTYPLGGSVSYTYSARTVSRANRQLTITAPAGYAEPRTWIAEDYVVVAWRQLNTDGTHSNNPKQVKLYVYQWVGEWKEKFLTDISGVSLDNSAGDPYRDYEKFEVSAEKDFFAVLSSGTSSSYVVRTYYKDESERGNWLYSGSLYTDYGDIYDNRRLSLVTGENFVIVGGDVETTAGHATTRWIFTKDGWIKTSIPSTEGKFNFYSGTNNYVITHNTSPVDLNSSTNPSIQFSYVTEDRQWIDQVLPSNITFFGWDRSYWYPSGSFALVMADDNDEFVYRWNSTYTTFYRDSKDVNNNNLFGQRTDSSPVNIFGNSLVAVNDGLSYFARFDGKYWYKSTVQSGADGYTYPSYSEDLMVCQVAPYISGGSFGYNGIRREFDPNQLLWKADYSMTGTADRGERVYAGNDFYTYGKNYYYRQPNGSWVKTVTTLTNSYMGRFGYPQFSVWTNVYPTVSIVDVKKYKNGALLPSFSKSGSVLRHENRFKNYGMGFETIITRPSSFADGSLATSITLVRFIKDDLSGNMTDYPVTLITTNDGYQNEYVSIDYNSSTAVVDASASQAQYNEVTVIPGCNGCQMTSAKPYGYTKTFFYNGLTYSELGVSTMPVDLRWTGLSYKTINYDANNTEVSSNAVTYSNFSKTLTNVNAGKVETANYVRVVETTTKQDQVTRTTSSTFDPSTGLVTREDKMDYDSKSGSGSKSSVSYKYFWQEYDPSRSLNILTPVIQTKNSVSANGTETVTDVMVTTWTTWNNVWAAHKNYQWRRSGSSDFSFTSWNGTGEPARDWLKLGQVDIIDGKGNILQVSK